MIINKKLIRYNFSGRYGAEIKYIIVHDTGNTNKGANALAHYNYFNSGHRNASAHYFVDSEQVVQTVEDFHSSWHCGDGKGKYGIWNSNSIGIEICINSDGSFENTLVNTHNLILYLMDKHKICKKNVLRHYDASGKICPRSLSPDNWNGWFDFHNNLYC